MHTGPRAGRNSGCVWVGINFQCDADSAKVTAGRKIFYPAFKIERQLTFLRLLRLLYRYTNSIMTQCDIIKVSSKTAKNEFDLILFLI